MYMIHNNLHVQLEYRSNLSEQRLARISRIFHKDVIAKSLCVRWIASVEIQVENRFVCADEVVLSTWTITVIDLVFLVIFRMLAYMYMYTEDT